MEIAMTSDIHGKMDQVIWPEADVLILAGDILGNFSDSGFKHEDAGLQLMYLEEFKEILAELPYPKIIFVPGNHDIVFEDYDRRAREILPSNCHVLINEEIVIDGIKFWGSPYTPYFYGKRWSFNLPDPMENRERARKHAKMCWEMIPEDTDVLITHGPPKGILDKPYRGPRVGCKHLREAVERVKPSIHVFGHIHFSYGVGAMGKTKFYNVSACGEDYVCSNPVVVVNI